jgi:hypothetical protein
MRRFRAHWRKPVTERARGFAKRYVAEFGKGNPGVEGLVQAYLAGIKSIKNHKQYLRRTYNGRI